MSLLRNTSEEHVLINKWGAYFVKQVRSMFCKTSEERILIIKWGTYFVKQVRSMFCCKEHVLINKWGACKNKLSELGAVNKEQNEDVIVNRSIQKVLVVVSKRSCRENEHAIVNQWIYCVYHCSRCNNY